MLLRLALCAAALLGSRVAGDGSAGLECAADGGASHERAARSGLVGNTHSAARSERAARQLWQVAAPGVITTVAGNGDYGFSGDNGPATSAVLRSPSGVAAGASGDVWAADTYNHRIRLVSASSGDIWTVAGNGTSGFSGDNGPATSATLQFPYGVAAGASGGL